MRALQKAMMGLGMAGWSPRAFMGGLAAVAMLILVGFAPGLARAAAADPAYPLRRVVLTSVGGGQGGPRGYSFYVSTKANPAAYNPVVYALHANGETVEEFAARTGWSKVAEDNGFVIVYPEAGNKTWSPFPGLENNYLKTLFDSITGNLTFPPPPGAGGGGAGRGAGGPGGPGGGPRVQRVQTWGAFHYITGDGAGATVAQHFVIDNPGLFAGVATVGGTAYRATLAKGDELAQGYFLNQRGGKSTVPVWKATKKEIAVPAWLITVGAPTAEQTALANYWKRANAVGATANTQIIGGLATAVFTNAAAPQQQVRTAVLPAGAKYDETLASTIWTQFLRRAARYTDAPNGSLIAFTPEDEINRQFEIRTIRVGDATYRYMVKTPSSYRKGTPMPVVLSAHGFGFPPWMYMQQIRMHELGEKEGFITVYLNGLNNSWNFDVAAGGDFKYVDQVIAEMKANYSVDATRVYMQGFSAGSGITLAEGMTNPRAFAAVSPNSGIGDFPAGIQDLVTKAKADGDVHIPMLIFYGALDAQGSTDALIPGKGVLRNAINNVKAFNNITTPDKVQIYDSAYTAPYEVLTPGGKFTKLGIDAHYPNGRFFRYDYVSADAKPLPLFSWVWVNDMMHGGDYRQAQMIWDFFKHWRRSPDGSLAYAP